MRFIRRAVKKHRHSDPESFELGVNMYFECDCGYRRVVRRNTGGMSPVANGWPTPKSPNNDSGWVDSASQDTR